MTYNFELFYDEKLTESSPYNDRNDYFGKALDRMDRSFAMIEPRIKNASMLDIGASPFYLLDRALSAGAERAEGVYFANDTHPLRNKTAIYSRHGAIGTYHLDIEKDPLPFEDNTFDIVSACEILEHLEYFPSWFGAEVGRVLKPSGRLLITVPNVGSIGNILKLISGRNIYMKYRSDPTGRHKHEYTAIQLRALIGYFGMNVVSAGYFPSPTSYKMWLRPAYRLMARTPFVRRFSPVLYILAEMPAEKPKSLGQPPAELYTVDRSIEE